MKRGCNTSFLFLAFFIPVFVYAGNTTGSEKQRVASCVHTIANVYAKMAGEQLPALVVADHILVSGLSPEHSGGQKNTHCHKIYAPTIDDSSSGPFFSAGTKRISPQKKYLVCIYPSHNFW